jgi:hypothetical protein
MWPFNKKNKEERKEDNFPLEQQEEGESKEDFEIRKEATELSKNPIAFMFMKTLMDYPILLSIIYQKGKEEYEKRTSKKE